MSGRLGDAFRELEIRLADADEFLEGYQRIERASVALAWYEQVFRSQGAALSSGALSELLGGELADLLARVPDRLVDQVNQLGWVADDAFLPRVEGQTVCYNPTLGYGALAADADLVVGETLWELKTTQGTKTRAGYRFAVTPELVRQLLGYVLLDQEDTLGVKNVGVYAARYGLPWTIPVDRLIRISGDVADDLPARRRAFDSLIT